MNPEPLTTEEGAARLGASLARLQAELARPFGQVPLVGRKMVRYADRKDQQAIALDLHADEVRAWAERAAASREDR